MIPQFLTLIAAIIAAAAAITGAVMSSITARKISRESSQAAMRKDALAFRRQRISFVQDLVLSNAAELAAYTACFQSVPWLTQTSLDAIHEKGETHIAKLQFGLALLEQFGIVFEDDRSIIPFTAMKFQSLCHAVYDYKVQLSLGNIEPSGKPNQIGMTANDGLKDQYSEWGVHLVNLKAIVSAACSWQQIRDV